MAYRNLRITTYREEPCKSHKGYCGILVDSDSALSPVELQRATEKILKDVFLKKIMPSLAPYNGANSGVFDFEENFPVINQIVQIPESFFLDESK